MPQVMPSSAAITSLTFFPLIKELIPFKLPLHPPSTDSETTVSPSSSKCIRREQTPLGVNSNTVLIFSPLVEILSHLLKKVERFAQKCYCHGMNNNIEQFTEEIRHALEQKQITQLSQVQQQCIPHAVKGEDILAQAPTGSGKTYAYLLPLLERSERQGKGKHYPQAVILLPTRELSLQTAETVRGLLSNIEGIRTAVLTGGVDMNAQVRQFAKGADIVIGTPSRICDHLRRHTFKPKMCHMAVLDEADVMLSMGFEEDVRTIMDALPDHQTMLFSATYTPAVEQLAAQYLRDPYHCVIEEELLLAQKTDYKCYLVQEHAKLDLLIRMLSRQDGQTLLFCNTRRTTDFVSNFLQTHAIRCKAIHSDMDPKVRKSIMQEFRSHELSILAATDVASRGIDIPAVSCVICYDMPDAMDDLIHRFGRTARAGNTGTACLYLTPDQKNLLHSLQEQFPSLRVLSYPIEKK